MTITLRSVKGAALTAAELDGNFTDLDERMSGLEDNPPEPNNIANITQDGSQITIHMQDGSTFGPFTLPRPTQRPTTTLAVTGTTLAPTLSQVSYYFRCTNASGCAVTIPANADVAFLVDTELHFCQRGAGAITFAGGVGVTVNVPAGFEAWTGGVGAVVTAKKVGTNEWDIFGLLAESA